MRYSHSGNIKAVYVSGQLLLPPHDQQFCGMIWTGVKTLNVALEELRYTEWEGKIKYVCMYV